MGTQPVDQEAHREATSGFGGYLEIYDQQVSFMSKQLAAHRACLVLREAAGSIVAMSI